MLNKGIVTELRSGRIFVWSKELGGEAILDKRISSTSVTLPSIGTWIVFSVRDDNFIDEFTEIPDLLPTKVNNDREVVMVKTRITFARNGYFPSDLLAHSKELGVIGIFRSFPNLSENCDYDAWVERIPPALSNLERLYKASWYISEDAPIPVVGASSERFSAAHLRLPRRSPPIGSGGNDFNDNASSVAIQPTRIRSAFSSSSSLGNCSGGSGGGGGEMQRTRELSPSRQSYFAQYRTFDPQPCTSTEESMTEEDETITGEEVVVGLITSTFNRMGFVWACGLGEGIIPSIGDEMRHGEWIKFIPSRIGIRYLQGGPNEAERCKYIAKECCIISPVYPTYAFRTTVSVQVKLFIPHNYRYDSSCLWTEFFGAVVDSLGKLTAVDPNDILGRCLLVRIIKMKNEFGNGSKWVIHKMLRILEEEESVPTVGAPAFAADALRYMNEHPQIRDTIERVDPDLAIQSRRPHSLSDDILKHRAW